MACTAAPFHPRRKNRKRMKQIDQITHRASHLSRCLRGLVAGALLAGTIITASAAAQPPFIGALYTTGNGGGTWPSLLGGVFVCREMDLQCGPPRTDCDYIYWQATQGTDLLASEATSVPSSALWVLADFMSGSTRHFYVKGAYDGPYGPTYESSWYLSYQGSAYSYCKYNTSTGVYIYNP